MQIAYQRSCVVAAAASVLVGARAVQGARPWRVRDRVPAHRLEVVDERHVADDALQGGHFVWHRVAAGAAMGELISSEADRLISDPNWQSDKGFQGQSRQTSAMITKWPPDTVRTMRPSLIG